MPEKNPGFGEPEPPRLRVPEKNQCPHEPQTLRLHIPEKDQDCDDRHQGRHQEELLNRHRGLPLVGFASSDAKFTAYSNANCRKKLLVLHVLHI